MKSFYLLLIMLCATLIGCSSTDKKPEQAQQKTPDCTFPDAPSTPAPDWICTESADAAEVAAVGSAPFSKAGYDFTEQMAATSARVKLAQRVKLQVQNMIKQYVETTGAADAETVDKVNTSVTKQITDSTLIGSKILNKRTSPNKTLYVLIGMDAKSVQTIAQESIRTSMNNENALWQQFKAQQGQAELAEAISKQE